MNKRKTQSKKAILECIQRTGNYGLKSDNIESELPQFNRVTIYRILQSFIDDGIIHKVISDDGKSYYFKCKNCGEKHFHNHYHFKCNICEKVECIDNNIDVRVPKDYKVEHVNFWISGVCNSCKK